MEGPERAAIAEAGRIHANAVRMVADELLGAEREAEEIRSAAAAEAAEVRREATEVMVERIARAEQSAGAIRAAAEAEVAAVYAEATAVLRAARGESQELRAALAALLERSTTVISAVDALFARLDELERTVGDGTALTAEVPPPPALHVVRDGVEDQEAV